MLGISPRTLQNRIATLLEDAKVATPGHEQPASMRAPDPVLPPRCTPSLVRDLT